MSRRRITQWLILTTTLVCVLFVAGVVVPEYRRHAVIMALVAEHGEIILNQGAGTTLVTTTSRLPAWFRDRLPTRWSQTCFVRLERTLLQPPLSPAERQLLDLFPEVRMIDIQGELTPADIRRLSQMPNLTTLEIQFARTSQGLEQLRGMKSLQNIELYVQKLRREDMEVLLSCPNLDSITLAGILDLEVVAELALHPRLKSLSLFNGACIKDTLFLYHEQPFSKHQFDSLAAFSKLDSLYLNELRPGELAAVPALPSLTKLKIFGDVTFLELRQLTRFPKLNVVTIDAFATRTSNVHEIRKSARGYKSGFRFYFWLREDPLHEILVDLSSF